MALIVPIRPRRLQEQALPGFRESGAGADELARAGAKLAGGIAAAAENIGEPIKAEALRYKQEQDRAAQLDAWTRSSKASEELLYDPQNGLVTQRGKDAIQNHQSVLTYWEAAQNHIRESLTNDDQRANFDEMVIRERDSFTRQVDQHVIRQGDEYARESYEGAVKASQSRAAIDIERGDIDGVRTAMQMARAATMAEVDRLGLKGPAADQMEATANANNLVTVVSRLVEVKDYGLAEQLLAHHDLLVQGPVDETIVLASKLGAIVRAGRDEEQVIADARRLYAQADGNAAQALELLDAEERTAEEAVGDPYADIMAEAEGKPAPGEPRRQQVYQDTRKEILEMASGAAQARRMQDTEAMGVYTQDLFAAATAGRQLPSLNNPALAVVSEDGKGEMARLRYNTLVAIQARKSAERTAREDAQEKRDRVIVDTFKGLDIAGSPGQDKTSADIDRMVDVLGGSVFALNAVRILQKGAQYELAKKSGLGPSEWDLRVQDFLTTPQFADLKPKEIDSLRRWLNTQRGKYPTPPQLPGTEPSDEWFDEQAKGWAKLVKVKGVIWDSEMTKAQAKMRGLPYIEEPTPMESGGSGTSGGGGGGGSAGAVEEQPGKRVKLVGPGGKRGTAEAGPDLDAWLSSDAGSGWRVEE